MIAEKALESPFDVVVGEQPCSGEDCLNYAVVRSTKTGDCYCSKCLASEQFKKQSIKATEEVIQEGFHEPVKGEVKPVVECYGKLVKVWLGNHYVEFDVVDFALKVLCLDSETVEDDYIFTINELLDGFEVTRVNGNI